MVGRMSTNIIDAITERVHIKNQNVILAITGETGTGKSWTALKIAEMVDPDFFIHAIREGADLSDRVTFSPTGFSRIVSKEKGLYKGAVIIFEEAGIGISANDWQKFTVKAIDKILQIFRYKNLVVIFTVPDLDYIAKKARRRVHYHIECLDISTDHTRKKTYNRCKVKRTKWVATADKLFGVYLRGKGGKKSETYFGRANIKLVHRYEDLALNKKDDLMEEIDFDLQLQDEKLKEKAKKKKVTSLDVDSLVQDVLNNPKVKPKMFGGRWIVSEPLIRHLYGLSRKNGKVVKELVELELELKDREKGGRK